MWQPVVAHYHLANKKKKTSVLFTGMQVFGTNTTENAVDAYSPDTEGTYVGGTRTCYAVKQKFRQKSKEILN